jgi:hypothetical protein
VELPEGEDRALRERRDHGVDPGNGDRIGRGGGCGEDACGDGGGGERSSKQERGPGHRFAYTAAARPVPAPAGGRSGANVEIVTGSSTA